MKIKTFPYDNFAIADPAAAVARNLRELFLRRMVVLDAVSMSMRQHGRVTYVDTASAARVVLDPSAAGAPAAPDPALRALHDRIYARFDDIHAVVTGQPPAAMSLLDAGRSLGQPTSMMKKRNVLKPDEHIVPAGSLGMAQVGQTLADARQRADAAQMSHLLILVRQWGLICCAPNLPEAVAHFQNVELLARLEVARLTM